MSYRLEAVYRESPLTLTQGSLSWRPASGFRLDGERVTFEEYDGRKLELPGEVPDWLLGSDPLNDQPFLMFELQELDFEDVDALLSYANKHGAFHREVCPIRIDKWQDSLNVFQSWMQRWDWENRDGPTGVMTPESDEGDQANQVQPTSILNDFGHHLRFSATHASISATAVGLVPIAYVQSIFATTERQAYPRCDVCQRRFKYVHQGGRAIQQYCSKACNAKAYRSRKHRARELFAAGMTPAKVAKELGSTTETVRGWLKK